MTRGILHIDMDAFYASVEERDHPELKGKPVIVGGSAEGRGVVSAANYAARKYGVHSAMPTARARRLCPHAVFLPVRMSHYAEVSRQIRGVFQRYTPLVEPLSLDEAFLDVTASEKLFGSPADIGRRIKREIADELGLTASVGIAPNKFLAKIASDLDKPDGFVEVDPRDVQAFLDPLPVSRIWGVGKATGGELRKLGIRTIAELRRQPRERIQRLFGKWGDHIWQLARGIDDRLVVPDHDAKSISHEVTFATDVDDPEMLRACLLELTEQVARRLRRHSLKGRTVQIKVRYADFRTITRAKTLNAATDVTQSIWTAASRLLDTVLRQNHTAIRLIGVGVSQFEEPLGLQGSLFRTDDTEKHRRVDAVSDDVQDRFGHGALRRATDLRRLNREDT
jgi:DNA polymerase-4